jgi:hypothetical protein
MSSTRYSWQILMKPEFSRQIFEKKTSPISNFMKIRPVGTEYSVTFFKSTDTLGICNTYCFSTATVVTRTRLIVTYPYIAFLVGVNESYNSSFVVSNLISLFFQKKVQGSQFHGLLP